MPFDFVRRTDVLLKPDPSRVLIRFFAPHSVARIQRVIGRVMSMNDADVEDRLQLVMDNFQSGHHNIRPELLRHYNQVSAHMMTDIEPSESRRLLLGAYFTSEYALESAALFNPSIVPHPDTTGVKKGSLRFVLSLRATGEGHLSSLEFRSGVIDKNFKIQIDEPSGFVTAPDLIPNPTYDKKVFSLKLFELGYGNDITNQTLAALNEEFTLAELLGEITQFQRSNPRPSRLRAETLEAIRGLAEANYEVCFHKDQALGARVIFPRSGQERKGIEDARFVKFVDEEDEVTYYATYTAYDGHTFLPQLLETKDFTHFRFITLNGDGAQNKGLALFPRKIDGRYVMLSRQDNENIFVMSSDNIHFWHKRRVVMRPSYPWEYVQLGNCGSPIETDEGWLVLTHGVGAMRRYCIGAILLDKEDPSRVIGRLKKPLLEPNENERRGYVPNVVYTCGALVHRGTLVMPYAMSDYAASVAMVDLNQLIQALKA